jgi:branched-chain amino acid transport system substrate-binding protein
VRVRRYKNKMIVESSSGGLLTRCLCAALLLGLAACADGSLGGNLPPWLTGDEEKKAPAPVVDKGKQSVDEATEIARALHEQEEKRRAEEARKALENSRKVVIIPPPPPPPPEPVVETPKLIAPVRSGPVRVALLVPLSGPEEALGRAMLNAAQLALFDIAPDHLMLMPRDTKGTSAGAQQAAEEVLEEGAEIILGPIFSHAVRGAAAPARNREINIVAFSTDITVAGNGVYLMGFTPRRQVDRVVAYAREQGLFRFAALAPANSYGDEVVNSLGLAVAENGAELVRVERYDPYQPEATDPARSLALYDGRKAALRARRAELEEDGGAEALAELKSLENAETLGDVDFDAVMIPDGGAGLRTVAPLLPYYEVDTSKVRFLGTGLWDDETLGREPSLVGGWFAGPDPDTSRLFLQRFEAAYGYRAPRISSLAYDATALVSVLAMTENKRADYSAVALTDRDGFAGADGLFRFNPDGLAERGLAVIEIGSRGLKVIDPAPTSFDKPGT